MISVGEAARHIRERTVDYGIESVPIEDCMGRVLREDLIADRDFPPFDRVAMDGIAIVHAAWQKGLRSFQIDQIAPAGAPQRRLRSPETCIEVMTGAILPEGCDTVIRYEDLVIHNGIAEIRLDSMESGMHIHRQGSDRRTGDVIVKSGTRIMGAELGVAATIGKSVLSVAGLPRIAVVSTGDELVEVSDNPLPHQIRKSNTIQIAALLRQRQVRVSSFHLQDDHGTVKEVLMELLRDYDCLILSGGVSAGKYDYIPTVLESLGVEKIFYKVAQKPGKPFWFGVKNEVVPTNASMSDSSRPTLVFALPGNPVSSFMCTVRYIMPWLEVCQGITTPPRYAVLTKTIQFKPTLTSFLQVKLSCEEDGVCYATPVEGHGSGDLANLVDGDGFLEMEEGTGTFKSGHVCRLWAYSEK